jgi:acyl carrier protein
MTRIEQAVRRAVADWSGTDWKEVGLEERLQEDLLLDDLDLEMIRRDLEVDLGATPDPSAITVADLCRDLERQLPLLGDV